MDENTWRFAQLMMWLIGIQTALLSAILGVIWSKLNRMENKHPVFEKSDKIEKNITEIDRQLCRLEGAFYSKKCCSIIFRNRN